MSSTFGGWHRRTKRVRSYEARVRWALTKMLLPVSCAAIVVLIALFQVGTAHGRIASELRLELELLSTIRADLVHASHLVGDYADSGSAELRMEYVRVAAVIDRELQTLTEFDESEEVRLGRAAADAWEVAKRDVVDLFAAPTRAGLRPAVLDVERQLEAAGHEVALLDASSRREMQDTSEGWAGASRVIVTVALIIGAAVIAVDLMLIRRFLKATFGPLRHLTDSVRSFSADDLSRRVELTGDREFRAVGESFNEMADRLERTFESLEHQAFHDALTGLPSRAGLLRHLRSATTGERSIVLFDLDDFKQVNDGLGHATGDEALFRLGRRLVSAVRPGDAVARFGGDEFVVVLEGVTPAEAVARAEELAAEISRPLDVAGRSVVLHASGGVAPMLEGDTPVEVFRIADVALYAAKDAGKQCVRAFSEEMLSGVEARLQMATDLRYALDRGEIAVHYQPTLSTGTGAVHGVEALMRWTHPQRGAVPPSTFIPVAEETGAIHALGRYVLETACRQAKAWQALPGLEDLSVNVNVSAAQLQTSDIVADVARALAAAELAPASLTIEVTESVLARPGAIAKIQALKALGVGIALDDFGTGYSSLSYLQRLPIDVLKIDKSFVDEVDIRGDRSVLACGIINLGHSLGMVTVAEGVERPEQRRALEFAGCDILQGYLIARPQPPEAAENCLVKLTKSAAPASSAA